MFDKQGQVAILGLHKFLTNPKGLPPGYSAMYFVFTVSCQPGWRTKAGYAGTVDVGAKYVYKDKELTLRAGSTYMHPIVAGVYPAFDTQEVNLRSSYRELITIAARLAAAGNTQGMDAFLAAAKNIRQEAETFTGLATVTSYSQGGRNFGYEFRPSFRAIERPGTREAKPGFRLDAVSFPVVAIAFVDQQQIIKAKSLQDEAASDYVPRKLAIERYFNKLKKSAIENLFSRLAEDAKELTIDFLLEELFKDRSDFTSSIKNLSEQISSIKDPTQNGQSTKQEEVAGNQDTLVVIEKLYKNRTKDQLKDFIQNLQQIPQGDVNGPVNNILESYNQKLGQLKKFTTEEELQSELGRIKDKETKEPNETKLLQRYYDQLQFKTEDELRIRIHQIQQTEQGARDSNDKKLIGDYETWESSAKKEVRARLDEGDRTIQREIDEAASLLASEVYLEFSITHSWRPIKPPWFHDWPLLGFVGQAFQKRKAEADVIDNAADLQDAREKIEVLEDGPTIIYRTLRKRWDMLEAQGLNLSPYVRLEPFNQWIAVVKDPNQEFLRWYGEPSVYVIEGDDFQGRVVGASIGGRGCQVEVVGSRTVIVTCDAWTPGPDANVAKAERNLAEAENKIAKAKEKLEDAKKRINAVSAEIKSAQRKSDDAQEIIANLKLPEEQRQKAERDKQEAEGEKKLALAKKAAAEKNEADAKDELQDAENKKKNAQRDKAIADAERPAEPAPPLDIVLITKQGPVKAGKVRFMHMVRPKASSGAGSRTADPSVTIHRNAAGQIVGVSVKGEFEDAAKLLEGIKGALDSGSAKSTGTKTTGQTTETKVDLEVKKTSQP